MTEQVRPRASDSAVVDALATLRRQLDTATEENVRLKAETAMWRRWADRTPHEIDMDSL